ncbi:hypothetical protein JXR93_06615 [bacterium]|nr:hypothetical protein [bacterium]
MSKIKNFGLKIFSVIFAFLIFLMVQISQSKEVIESVKIKLSLSIPENYILGNDIPEEISLLVKGPKKNIRDFEKKRSSIFFDVENSKIITIQKDNFGELDRIEIIKIIPESINVSIEKRIDKIVPITLNTINDLPEGVQYQKKPTIKPEQVTITGPQSYVSLIESVYTEPFNQKNISESGDSTILKLKKESSFISFKDIQAIKVSYKIEETTPKKEFENIEIEFLNCNLEKTLLIPLKRSINIIAKAPYSTINKISAKDFKAYADLKDCDKIKHSKNYDISVTVTSDLVKIEHIIPDSVIINKKSDLEEQ